MVERLAFGHVVMVQALVIIRVAIITRVFVRMIVVLAASRARV